MAKIPFLEFFHKEQNHKFENQEKYLQEALAQEG